MLHSLELFAGAGGFTLGLESAGIRCEAAIELDRFACQTFRCNHPRTELLEADVRSFSADDLCSKWSGIDVLVAAPPCQGFSVAGPSQYGKIDERNDLLLDVIRFVQALRPVLCIVENVKGILNGKLSRRRRALDEYVSGMQRLGYVTSIQLLQTANFGVPQWRERVFIFAARKQKYLPTRFEPTYGTPARPWISVWEAISDLPTLGAGEGSETLVPYTVCPETDYQVWLRQESRGITNHQAMKHSPRLIQRFKHIPIGGSLVNAPSEYGQRLRNGHELDARMRFKMNNQRLDPATVSTAITASFQSNFIHPCSHRNLTAREGARLQSFPDRFIFHGPRTLMSRTLLLREGRTDEIGLSQYNQIGNAVPPLLATAIGEACATRL